MFFGAPKNFGRCCRCRPRHDATCPAPKNVHRSLKSGRSAFQSERHTDIPVQAISRYEGRIICCYRPILFANNQSWHTMSRICWLTRVCQYIRSSAVWSSCHLLSPDLAFDNRHKIESCRSFSVQSRFAMPILLVVDSKTLSFSILSTLSLSSFLKRSPAQYGWKWVGAVSFVNWIRSFVTDIWLKCPAHIVAYVGNIPSNCCWYSSYFLLTLIQSCQTVFCISFSPVVTCWCWTNCRSLSCLLF